MGKPREWWLGITDTDFDKWLARKNPEDKICPYAFISLDGIDKCKEIVHVIEYSSYDELNKHLKLFEESIRHQFKEREDMLLEKNKLMREALGWYASVSWTMRGEDVPLIAKEVLDKCSPVKTTEDEK